MTQPQTEIKYEASYTGLQKRAIDGKIFILESMETPFISYFGFDGGRDIVDFPNNDTIEWTSDVYRTLSGSLGGATLASDGTAITGSTACQFKVGDVVEIDSEYVQVTAVDTGDREKATIGRAVMGTKAATHASDATYTIISNARREGADTTYGVLEDPSTHYNNVQTFQDAIKLSRHASQMVQWHTSDEFMYQRNKKVKELTKMIELTIFKSKGRQTRTSSAEGHMGGLQVFITDNTLSTARTALTIGNLQGVMRSCFDDGGKPDIVVVNPQTLQTITDLYQSSNYLRVERGETKRGMKSEMLVTDWGDMTILQGRNVPAADIYFLQSEYIGLVEAFPFTWYEVPRTGDFVAAEIIGDYSLVVKNDKAHAHITLT